MDDKEKRLRRLEIAYGLREKEEQDDEEDTFPKIDLRNTDIDVGY